MSAPTPDQPAIDALVTRLRGASSPTETQARSNGHTSVLSDDEIITRCRKAKNAAKFSSLFDEGDTSRYQGDDSDADFALLGILKFYSQDPEQLDRLFRRSALYRPKWDQRRGARTYGQRTIDEALSSVAETYSKGSSDYANIHSVVPSVEVATESISREIPFKTARAIAQETPAKVEWCVYPYVAKGAITEIDGKIKAAGKTTFISHMAACVVAGRQFMGSPTRKTKVLWLTEQSPTSFRKVLERAGLTDCEDILVLHWHDVADMEWEAVARAAIDKAIEIDAGMLVVDTLGQFAGIKGDAENSAGAAQEAMRPLQQAAACGVAVVTSRHERKGGGDVGESGRGSSAFGGAVDVILSLRRGEGNTRPTVRVVESLSRFDETPDKVMVELTDDGYRNLGDASAFAEKEAMQAIVEMLPAKPEHAMTTGDIVDRLKEQNVKRTVVMVVLPKLVEVGTISRLGEGKKGKPYRYYKPIPNNEDEELEDQESQDGPGKLESPDPVDEIHSVATTTYIRPNEKKLSEGNAAPL